MSYKVNDTTVIDDSKNVCACCVTSCCVTASDQMVIPSGTTACRPTGATGSLYFDTDEGALFAYNGTEWTKQGGAGVEYPTLATSSTDSWSIMSVVRAANTCFGSCCCCGVPNVDNKRAHPLDCWSYCQNISLRVCNIHYYICNSKGACCGFVSGEGPRSHCPISYCAAVHIMANSNSVANELYPYNIGGGDGIYCAGVDPNLYIYEDGSARFTRYRLGTRRPFCSGFGDSSPTGEGFRLDEVFMSNKGALSCLSQDTLKQCLGTCHSCGRLYGGMPAPLYLSSAPGGGAVAFVRNPCLSHVGNVDSTLGQYQVYIPTTSDSYGTDSIIACCWVLQGCAFNCFPRPVIRSFGTCSGVCDTFLGCFATCTGGTFCSNVCCRRLSDLNPLVTSSRTDVFGGSAVATKEGFNRCICQYSSGITKYARNLTCCVDFYFRIHNHYFNCQNICGSGAERGLITPDGCCFIFFSADQITSCVAQCCCCFDTQRCWKTLTRPHITVINRLQSCIKSINIFCCVCYLPWECDIMGCVRGSGVAQTPDPCYRCCDWFSNRLCPGYSSRQLGKSVPYNSLQKDIIATVVCGPDQAGKIIDSSYYNWSTVCDRLAYFDSASNAYTDGTTYRCPSVVVYDRCKESFTCRIMLKLECTFRFISMLSQPTSCWTNSNICPSACGMIAALTDNCSFSTVCNCVCSVAGQNVSLFQKCLGYNLWPTNCCYTCLIILEPTNGSWAGNTYINPENDHLVMIRALGHGCNCYCGKSRKLYWIGAICYDLHNCCISKINTLWPDSQTMCLFCKKVYDCAANCVNLSADATALNIGGQGFSPGTFACNCCCTNYCVYGMRAFHYGNRDTYIASGCTDHGGMYIVSKDLTLGCGLIANCSSSLNLCSAYFGCCCTGKSSCVGRCSDNTGVYACLLPKSLLSKVPYSTPLECVGWRSEPFFACLFNTFAAPYCVDWIWGGMLTSGSTGHKCLAFCAFCCTHSHFFTCKCNKVDCCCVIYYGSRDCMKNWCQIWTVRKSCDMFRSCCCTVTGCNNGCCKYVTFDTIVCCLDLTNKAGCTTWLLDNVKPCHWDCKNTKEAKINKFTEALVYSQAPVPMDTYDNCKGSIEGRWMHMKTGENYNDRLLRFWNEDVIDCC